MKTITIPLNDKWYVIDGNGAPEASYHKGGIPREEALETSVPVFTSMLFEDHVGISWFERDFTLNELPAAGQVALLAFEQAVFRTEVSVNGTLVGEHVGVEDPFAFDVTDELRVGMNRITVRVSKPHIEPVDGYTFDEIPHRNQTPTGLKPGWCYNESGISGEVFLRILPRVCVDDLALLPDPDTGAVRVLLTLRNASAEKTEVSLALEIRRAPDGDAEDERTLSVMLYPGENEIETVLTVTDMRLWSVKDPNLYAVRAAVTSVYGTHSAVKKTGFRTFRVGDDGYFYLNGERIYVRSSHTGNCFPESVHIISSDRELLRRDFLLAKSVGFNMIRFISGSALPLQLDLCDEIGLMIYEEPVGSWLEKNGPHAVDLYRADLLTMVRRDRSHPSVTIWGLLNETKSEPPFDEVCFAARDILPELRRLDPSRLVLYSSGRWDKDASVGSLSNPGETTWQNLWGTDGIARTERGELGDIHYYPGPYIPMNKGETERMRSFGKDAPKPVFVSESGIGSALDTIAIARRFAQTDAVPFAPDVKLVRRINDALRAEIDKFGFRDCLPFPSELMRASFRNHVYYRTQMFDLLRSNPNVNGISLTGLLDHSVCGEGLWTLFREFKPQIADVLQDGFAPLRWNVILSAPAVFRGSPLHVEASLATENVLRVGQTYTARAAILDREGRAYGVRDYTFTVTAEQEKTMVVPVFDETWDTSELPEGEYEFKADLLTGADASGGVRLFHVAEPVFSHPRRTVVALGLSADETAAVASLGFILLSADDYSTGVPVLAGTVTEENRPVLEELLFRGASVLCAHAAVQGDLALTLLPESRRPTVNRTNDWLYHRETFLRPGGRFFTGMRTGLADARLYTGVLTPFGLEAAGDAVPDEVDAFVFGTGIPNDRGFIDGFALGTYRLPSAASLRLVTLNIFSPVPYSRRLLCNLLDEG